MNRNDPAYPMIERPLTDPSVVQQFAGLTKREMFAAMAMQGLLACDEEGVEYDMNIVAGNAVAQADALIAELSK